MDFRGKSFLFSVVDKVSAIADSICIVCGFHAAEIEKAVRQEVYKKYDILLVKNQTYQKGMLTSLQTGIAALKSADWILYHFVDQPHIPGAFYTAFRNQIREGTEWIQPRFRNKNGHPILIHKTLIEPIVTLSGQESLRDLNRYRNFRKTFWDCPFPQIAEDFDTVEDLSEYRTDVHRNNV